MPRSSSTPKTPLQKGCGTVFFGAFALVGLLFFGAITASMLRTVRSYFWAETPCIIVESRRVEPGPEAENSDGYVIRYRYRVAGRERTSSQFTVGMKESLDAQKIEKLLLRYPEGARVMCYVDGSNPDNAVLKRGTLWIALVLLFPLIFLAVGVGGIVGTWWPGAISRALSPRDSLRRAASKFAPMLFFGLFALVGGVLGYFIAVRPLMLWFDARSWPETSCEIVSSSVGSHRSTSGSGSSRSTSTTYSVDITYRYTVGGREYRSDRYEVMGASSSGRSRKEQVVARYPAGSRAVCYVNPKDPTEALLNRSLSPFLLVGLIPLLFFVVGAGGLVHLLRSALKASRSVAMPGVPTLPVQPPPVTTAGGPVILKPSASPLGKFIGALLIAAFWNGITSIFVVQVVKSWQRHHPEYFLTLFMIPFVLVGIGLLGFVGAMFLNLFNPRVALAVSSQSVPLGGSLDLRWSFRGAVSRIRHLRIVIEGREQATYRRGTSTSTDKQIFAQLPLVETGDAQQIREGRAQLTIPERLMHTWDGGSNKIVWELQVRGDIPCYPDVSEDFDFTVLPQGR